MAEVPVFSGAQRVGSIGCLPDGPAFSYHPDWLHSPDAFPISIAMPLSPAPVPPAVFRRWAAGLLPRGVQLAALARQIGVAPHDTFGILASSGRDTASTWITSSIRSAPSS